MNKLFLPHFVRNLDSEILRRWPKRRGWLLLDASERNLPPLWAHERSYLRDKDVAPGFRIEPAEHSAPQLPASNDYVIVFVRCVGQNIAPAALEMMVRANQQSLQWLTIELDHDSGAVKIIDEGEAKPLASEPTALRAEEIELTIEAETLQPAKRFLPFEVQVDADTPNAFLTVRVPEDAGFSRASYSFLVSGKADQALGHGRLHVDVKLRPGQPDVIGLCTSGFSSEVRCDEWVKPPGTDQSLRFDQRPLALHLLYDRTSLDAESWTTAVAAADGLLGEAEKSGADEVFSKATIKRESGNPDEPTPVPQRTSVGAATADPQRWNRLWREHLGRALAAALDGFHHSVSIRLWWFADVARDGIDKAALPVLTQPWGQVGSCAVDNLAERLSSSSFDYASGLDLFDAVDESLHGVASSLRRNHGLAREQHLVLIVGDSPPPPKDQEDKLWEHLVENPVRANARCSPLFRQSLQELNAMGIPVAWLFLRAMHPPADTPHQDFLKDFQAFQTLKERVLEALQQIEIDGLIVEGCESPEELEPSLRNLFRKIKYGRPKVPAFRIIRLC